MVRTRFAPSPTGKPHVGNIRTAIFDYLEARSKKGEFILRIEDTDRERFVPEAVTYIEESLRWLGLHWDNEKIEHQSDRLDIYKKYVDQLVGEGKAYKCFCTKERLEDLRKKQIASKKPPGYDGHCRQLSKEDITQRIQKKENFVIRFRIPQKPEQIVWEDLVRGQVSIKTNIQEDFIIVKSDGFPTYHLANVVDDHEMKITTVIRGEEWIPSVPKHILLYQALGWKPPDFAHMPLIVGKDKAKLSKRHGASSILEYKEIGYLPDAMLNFLATLGWNDGTTEELFTKEELEIKFDIRKVGKAPAVFDIDKLNWINGEKIRAMSVGDLMKKIGGFDPKFVEGKDKDIFEKAVTVLQTRIVTLKDFIEQSNYFFEKPMLDITIIVFKKSTLEETKKGLEAVLVALDGSGQIETAEHANEILTRVVEDNHLSNGDIFWPVRVALSGEEKSASPGEILWALGKKEASERISEALKKL